MHHHKFFGDETERHKWQDPESILLDIGLKSSLTFVDVGCGEGFFAIPAARIVGRKGKVYALDYDEEVITVLEEKAAKEGLANLRTRVGAAEEIVFCKACADIVFFSIVLHDFNDVTKVLANARRMLKHNGHLVDLDWKKKPMHTGPPLSIRFSERYAANLIKEAGFKIEQTKEALPYHYIIIARPLALSVTRED